MTRLFNIFRSSKLLFYLLNFVFTLIIFAHPALADRTWDGGAGVGDTRWSNPVNWSGDSLPGPSDVAIFDSTSGTKNANIGTSISVKGIQLSAGYSGTINVSAGVSNTIVLGSSGYSQASGAFNANNANIGDSASFNISGGTFTPTSATTTVTNNFTVTNSPTLNAHFGNLTFVGNLSIGVTCGNAIFDAVTLNKSPGVGTINFNSQCNIPISGTNPSSTGLITNNGVISVTGNWNLIGTYTGNVGASLTVTGTGISLPTGLWQGNMTFNSGTVFVANSLTNMVVGGALNNSANVLPNNLDLTFYGSQDGSVTCGNAIFHSVAINKTATGYYFTVGAGCTIPLAGTNPAIGGSLTNNGNVGVTGNLSLTGAYAGNSGAILTTTGTGITVGTDLTINTGTSFPTGLDITFNGNSSGTLTCGNATFNTVTINKSTTASQTISNGCNITIGGTNPSSSTHDVYNHGIINVNGNWTVSTAYVGYGDGVLNMTGDTFNVGWNMTLNSGTSLPSTLKTLTVGGDLNNSGNALPPNLDVTFNTGNSGSVTCGNAAFNSVAISKTTSSSITFNSGCTIPLGGTNPSTTAHDIYNYGTINANGNWTTTTSYTGYSGSSLNLTGSNFAIGYNLVFNSGAGLSAPALTSINVGGDLNNTGNVLPNGLDVVLDHSYGGTTTCGNATFNSVTINRSGSITDTIGAGCIIPLGGTNPSTSGNIVNNGRIDVTGTWSVGGYYTGNSGSILNMTGNSLTTGSDITLNSGSSMPANLNSLTVGGVLNNAANILSDGIDLTLNSNGSVNLTPGSARYNSFTVNKGISSYSITLTSNFSTGNFTLTRGTIANPSSPYILNIAGNFSEDSGTTLGGANLTLNFNGSGTQTLSKTAGTFVSKLNIGSSGTVQLLTTFATSGQTCIVQSGIFDLNGQNFTCGSTFTVQNGGNLRLIGSETVTTPTLNAGSNVLYVGISNGLVDKYTINNWSYSNLTVGMTEPGDELTSQSFGNTNNLEAYWNLDEVGTTAVNSVLGATNNGKAIGTTIIAGQINNARSFNGTSDYISGLSSPDSTLTNWTMTAWVKLNSTNQAGLIAYNGNDSGGYGLAVSGTGGANGNTYMVLLGGVNWYSSGTTLPSTSPWYFLAITRDTSTIRFYVNGSASPNTYINAPKTITSSLFSIGAEYDTNNNPYRYFNGSIDDVRYYNRTLSSSEISQLYAYDGTPVAAVTVGNNLNITSGTMVSPATLTVNGNFNNNATFNANSGTVNLNGGNQTITGASTFYNLTKTVSSGSTLTFPSSTTQTITNAITLTGTNGNLLSLASSNPGTQWNIALPASRTLDYLVVADSRNTGAVVDQTGLHLTNGGNTTNWGFNNPPSATVPSSISQATDGSGLVTFSTQVSDPDNNSTKIKVEYSDDGGSTWYTPHLISATPDSGSADLSSAAYQIGSTDAIDTNGGAVTLSLVWDTQSALNGHGVLSGLNSTVRLRVTPNDNSTDGSPASTTNFMVDNQAPSGPSNLASSTHTSSVWSNNNQIHFTWTAASDGSGIGLSGYAYIIDTSPTTDPTSVPNLGSVTTLTSSTLPSASSYYLHLKPVDNNGNWGSPVAYGPFLIDTISPANPGVPVIDSPTASNQPPVTWTDSTDTLSGLADPAYTLAWTTDPDFVLGIQTTGVGLTAFTPTATLADGTWYFKVRAADAAGNTTPYTSAASVVVDTTPPTTPGTPGTTTPTNSTTQSWNWSTSTDAITAVVGYLWRTTGSAVTMGTTTLTNLVTNLGEGVYNFYVRAMDSVGNLSVESLKGVLTVDRTAPLISSIIATPANIGVTITWTTSEGASSRINYGLTNSYGVTTPTTDVSPRVTSHTVSIPNLVSCVTYHYQVVSTDAAGNSRSSSDQSFTTSGCVGSAAINSENDQTITVPAGGGLNLIAQNTGLALTVPESFSDTDTHFQIKQLEKTAFIAAASSPDGFSAIGNYIYDLKALVDVNTLESIFDHPLTITIAYEPGEISGIDESTLTIYRYDEPAWTQLSNCTLDTTVHTVTCNTDHFSVFTLVGQQPTPPAPTPTAAPAPSSPDSSALATSSP
ncbi:hypothetical protein M1116_03655, partial [Patescibacteria group bacterium]|nr:hypothetical protein [Patescibacteria group bacterium]